MWDLPKLGVDPVSFALQGSFLTTNHQGNHMFFSSNHTQYFWHQKCDFFFLTTTSSLWQRPGVFLTLTAPSANPSSHKTGSHFRGQLQRVVPHSPQVLSDLVASQFPLITPLNLTFARSVPRSQGSAYLTSLLYCKGNAKGNRWTFRWRCTERLGRVFEHRSFYPCRAGTCHPPGTWMCSLAGKNSKSWT